MRRFMACVGMACVAGVTALGVSVARAEPVELVHGSLTLNGDLRLAEGKSLADGAVLLVHGTLAHHGMEIIAGQQERLNERGLTTLAVTLSLGQDRRSGMADCSAVQTHRHEDAAGEIAAWVGWLKAQGAGPLTVLGHSRGGNQVARFSAEEPAAAQVARWILVAPATWSPPQVEAPSFVAEAKAKVAAGQGEVVMTLPAFLYCQDAKATAAAVASYYADDPRFDTPRLLAAMPKPVLVVVGAGDDVVPDLPAHLEANGVPDGVQVETVADAGHMFRDFAADDLADLIAAFASGGNP